MNTTATTTQTSPRFKYWKPTPNCFKRARINVKAGSAYAHLNGKEFEVVEQYLSEYSSCGTRTSVSINGQTTDFYGDEVTVTTIKIPKQPLKYYEWGNEPEGHVSTWKVAANGEVVTLGYISRDKLPKSVICECPYN